MLVGIPFGLLLAVNKYFRESFSTIRNPSPNSAASMGTSFTDLLAYK